MAERADLVNWLEAVLGGLGGEATLVEVSRRIWEQHEEELRASGDLFYTWQYDLRWAAHRLRRSGRMKAAEDAPSGTWQLSDGKR